MKRHHLVLTVLLTLQAIGAGAQPADRCSDILRGGVFDTAYLKTDHKYYRLFQHAFCRASSQENKASLEQTFSYLTPTENYAGAWNASNYEQKKDMFCAETLDQVFTQDSLESFISKASPIIVDAWTACMKQRSASPLFSARYSNDLRDVVLEADSGVAGLPLAFNGRKRWQEQISVLPVDALKSCKPSGFSSKLTRDAITCRRSDKSLKEPVTVKLLTQYGDEQPLTELPPLLPPPPPSPPALRENVYLSKELEIGTHTFQAVQYRTLVGMNSQGYDQGVLFASQDSVGSVISYRIPPGAKTFAVDVVSYQAGNCDGVHGNGWTVMIETPKQRVKAERSWNYIDAHRFEIPVDDIPYGAPRKITITVDPHGNRTCDHSGLGNPHFKPMPPQTASK